MNSIKVKNLVWKEISGAGWKAKAWGLGSYFITQFSGDEFELCESYPGTHGPRIGAGFYPTLEAAKSAAQEDHEARTLAALEPAPVSVQEAARVLLDAESDGEVWRTYVNAMMPILREDMSADSWHTVDEIRGAMIAALRALAGDEGER